MSFNQIMLERWEKLQSQLPMCDQVDDQINSKVMHESKQNQHAPEYTQQCYESILAQEKKFLLSGYLNSKSTTFDSSDRSHAVQLMLRLHQEKGYKQETIYFAVGIFDRYIRAIGPSFITFQKVIPLAVVCTLMSAKLSEPISPSFNRMIRLLSVDE